MSDTPHPINTHVRMFDLVRFMRSELLRANLITEEEHAWLCHESPMAQGHGSPSPRRLEDYDDLRKQLAELHSARRGDAETHAQEQGALMASETALRDKLIDTERELQKLRGFYDQVVAEVGHDRIVQEYRQRGELLRQETEARKEAERIVRELVDHKGVTPALIERAQFAELARKLAESERHIRSARAETDDVRSKLSEAEIQRDALVAEIVKVASWSDTSYLHALTHVANLVNNLRADCAVAEKGRDQLRAEVERLKRSYEGELKVGDGYSIEVGQLRAEVERLTKALEVERQWVAALTKDNGTLLQAADSTKAGALAVSQAGEIEHLRAQLANARADALNAAMSLNPHVYGKMRIAELETQLTKANAEVERLTRQAEYVQRQQLEPAIARADRSEAAQATLQSEINRLREDTCAQTINQLRAQLAADEKAASDVIAERDEAERILDDITSDILGEPIDWGFHDAKWAEAAELASGLRDDITQLRDTLKLNADYWASAKCETESGRALINTMRELCAAVLAATAPKEGQHG